jgi:arylsulfatase A-like enzyme
MGGVGAAAALLLVVTGTMAAGPDQPRRGVTGHVIIISLDGLRPDAIVGSAPSLAELMRTGAFATEAVTVVPSQTLPSHTSMLTGVLPATHGITWNSDRTARVGPVQVATIFQLAREHGLRTAAFFGKSKLRHLLQPGALDYAQAPTGLHTVPATTTVEAAVRYMRFSRPDLVFIHIAEPDVAGHSFGWMSWVYRLAVRRADAAASRILAGAEAAYGAGNYTVIVTSDHGGRGRGHGAHHPDNELIPWITWGAGVRPGPVTGKVRTVDTAATALWLLGITPPTSWDGRPVTGAYVEAPPEQAVRWRGAVSGVCLSFHAQYGQACAAAGIERRPARTRINEVERHDGGDGTHQ